MELSKRLTAVAGLVTEGASVADIGTDHGYVPIYLMKQGKAKKVIATDINRGPLERARMHVIGYGLKGKIETRLSDGLGAIRPGEVDTVIVAGMGGNLVIRILNDGKDVVDSLDACVLQPQSEIAKVRRYLVQCGLMIEREDMVEEDCKFYPMMRVIHGEPEQYEDYEYLYGKRLLEMRHPVLKKYLLRERGIQESIVRQLSARKGSESARKRLCEMQEETERTLRALECYDQ